MLHGRGRHSGAEAAMPMAHAVWWRDRLLVWAKSYTKREDALNDLGTSAGKLSRIDP